MRPFHLREEEVALINHLRNLSARERDMVACLISDLERKTDQGPWSLDNKIALIRATPSR